MSLHVENNIGVVRQVGAAANSLDHAPACEQAPAGNFPANIVTSAARHIPGRLHGTQQICVFEKERFSHEGSILKKMPSTPNGD